jgi:hypothetical protein
LRTVCGEPILLIISNLTSVYDKNSLRWKSNAKLSLQSTNIVRATYLRLTYISNEYFEWKPKQRPKRAETTHLFSHRFTRSNTFLTLQTHDTQLWIVIKICVIQQIQADKKLYVRYIHLYCDERKWAPKHINNIPKQTNDSAISLNSRHRKRVKIFSLSRCCRNLVLQTMCLFALISIRTL